MKNSSTKIHDNNGMPQDSSISMKVGLRDLQSEVSLLEEEIQRLFKSLEFCLKPDQSPGTGKDSETETQEYSLATREILNIKEQIITLQKYVSYIISILDIE